MLESLSIKNYILIDDLTINWSKGFSVITGETGAGKSILLGALNLLLGKRTDASVVKNKDQSVIIEASFVIDHPDLIKNLENIDIKRGEKIWLRRVIFPNGKSRSFLNEIPINLAQIKDLQPALLEIHSQHQNQQLKDPAFQLNLIDAVAQTQKELENYQATFKTYQQSKKKLETKNQLYQEKIDQKDFYTFQLEKFEILDLDNFNLENLEEAHENIQSRNYIKSVLSEIMPFFQSENSIGSQLEQLTSAYGNLTKKMPSAQRIQADLVALQTQFQTIESAQYNLLESLEGETEDPEIIEKKMGAVYQLFETFRVQKIDDLIAIRQKLLTDIESIEVLRIEIETLGNQLKSQKKDLENLAQKLSEKRQSSFVEIETKLVETLINLGLEKAQIKIEQKKCSEFGNSGQDEIYFTFTANPETELQPIGTVASGGEIARISLAMKTLMTSHHHTIIFDEIDTGVSGRMAEKMGQMMVKISQHRPVVSITHLPQIAALGNTHFEVQKSEKDQKHSTQIQKLNRPQRTEALAKLLSGEKMTDEAWQQAQNLLHRK